MAGSVVSSRDALDNSRERAPKSGRASLLDLSRVVRHSDFALCALVSIVFTAIAAAIVFSRSEFYIELADQSLYLLMIDNPEASIRSASGFHVLLSPLFSVVDESVINFRRLRAVLDIGVDLGLGISLLRYLKSKGYSGLFDSTPVALTVIFTVTLSGFSSWIYAVNGFGYDQLGAIIFTLLATVLLWILGSEAVAAASTLNSPLVAVFGGAIFSLALIVRWTAAVTTAILILVVLIEYLGSKRTMALLRASTVGVVGAFGLIHLMLIDLQTLAGGIVAGTVDVSRDSHSLMTLVGEYATSSFAGLASGIGLLLAAAFALVLIRFRNRFDKSLLLGLVTAGFVMFAVQTAYGLPHFIEALSVGTFLCAICGVLIVDRVREHRRSGESSSIRSSIALPVALAAMPILLAAGSLLPIFLTSLPLVPLWVAVLWIMVPNVKSAQVRSVSMLISAVLLSGMPWLVWQGFDTPARTPLAEQPALVERGRYEGLRVDPVTQQLLHDLEDLRPQLDPNPTVLSFWVRPAVPFALNGTGIGFPWYNVDRAPNAAAETISGACIDDGAIPTGDVVFVTEEPDPISFGPIREALADCAIDFPTGFELIDTMVAPGNVELFVYLRDGEG